MTALGWPAFDGEEDEPDRCEACGDILITPDEVDSQVCEECLRAGASGGLE